MCMCALGGSERGEEKEEGSCFRDQIGAYERED